jgi:3-oxoacyl-[acyl-carrier-protein] synthase II
MAVAAATLALKDAGLGSGAALGAESERVAVYCGCSVGGATALDTAYRASSRGDRIPPLSIPALMPNAPAAHVAMRHGVKGNVITYSVACASAAVAMVEAVKAIRSGEIDVAFAGGTEAQLVPRGVESWQAMQTLSSFAPGQAATSCRPFAVDRTGFVLGEGSAFMMLESAEHARARGARIYAELSGVGLSCDATNLTKPDVPGQSRAIRTALAQAGLSPADVGYCNAHGTATKIGDVVEAETLRAVWGSHIDRLKVSSTKALHGHLLGATGALEAVITVLALHHQRLPPNAHCDQVDPACALNLVAPNPGQAGVSLSAGAAAPDLQAALSNSFAFGGTNAVLVFSRA